MTDRRYLLHLTASKSERYAQLKQHFSACAEYGQFSVFPLLPGLPVVKSVDLSNTETQEENLLATIQSLMDEHGDDLEVIISDYHGQQLQAIFTIESDQP